MARDRVHIPRSALGVGVLLGVLDGVLLGVLLGVFEGVGVLLGVLEADRVIHSVRPVAMFPAAFIPK